MNSQMREFSKVNLDLKNKIDEVDVSISSFREIFKIIRNHSELLRLLKLVSKNLNVSEEQMK